MNIYLMPQLEEFVKQKIESGLYHSASEVIRDALLLMEEIDRIREMRLEALRKEIQKGLDSGPSIPGEEVFARLRNRLTKQQQEE